MERVVERCAGLDVHRDTVTACVRVPGVDGGRVQELREFGTTTVELLALRDWLMAWGVTVVAMESTGVYWKPVFYLVEDDIECWLTDEPTTFEPGEPLEAYLRTVVLGSHLARLPESEHDAFVRAVAAGLPAPRIDYVRLNIVARRDLSGT